MAETLNLGFYNVGPAPGTQHLGGILPDDLNIEFGGMYLYKESLLELWGVVDDIVEFAVNVSKGKNWDAFIMAGAPTQLMNPTVLRELKAALNMPVCTAMQSCSAALKALGAKKLLMMTPFDDLMNDMLGEYMKRGGFEPNFVGQILPYFLDGVKQGPEAIYTMATEAFAKVGGADAIYFQGGWPADVSVIDRLEKDLGCSVVASNPGMLWYMLSTLGRSYSLKGSGKLVLDWPALP